MVGLGADAIIEAMGAAASTMGCVYVARKRAHFVQAGIGKHIIDYPIFQFSIKELHMHGAFRHNEGDYRGAIDILEHKLVLVRDLITAMFDFEDVESAWKATLSGTGIKTWFEESRTKHLFILFRCFDIQIFFLSISLRD